jgi:hypothetical protein
MNRCVFLSLFALSGYAFVTLAVDVRVDNEAVSARASVEKHVATEGYDTDGMERLLKKSLADAKQHDAGVVFRLRPDAKVTTFRQKQAKVLAEVYHLSEADIRKPINLWGER